MTSEETKPSATSVTLGFGLTLTVLGGVCGALLTEVLSTLGQSDPRRWIGLALGAALPPVIAALPQAKRKIQVGAAILLSVAAFLLAYFGQFALTSATDRPPNLPTPYQIAGAAASIIPTPTPTPTPTPDDGTAGRYEEGDLKMAWTPQLVHCDDKGCGKVIVTSEGAAPLRITSLEIQGEDAQYLKPTGCVGVPLNQGDACTITLDFKYEAAPSSGSAVLVIHQNFKGPATEVPIDARGKGEPDKKCTVPDDVVEGAQRDDAVAAIKTAGLRVAEQFESSSEKAGTVLNADPAAGEEVECGTTVTIAVATSGPEPCTVPDVVDMPRNQAATEIQEAGLMARDGGTEASSTVPEGNVVRSAPVAGAQPECGSAVTMFVSSGPNSVG